MTTLADIDDFYKTTISKLPTADKLSYCRQQLDRLQHIPSPYLTDILKEIIKATQYEIHKLEK